MKLFFCVIWDLGLIWLAAWGYHASWHLQHWFFFPLLASTITLILAPITYFIYQSLVPKAPYETKVEQ